MSLEIVTVACRTDNYAFLARDDASGMVALIDAPEAAAIIAELDARGWGLDEILLTHHHDDHVEGVAELVSRYGAKVTGAEVTGAKVTGAKVTGYRHASSIR